MFYVLIILFRDGRVMGVLEVSRSLGDGPYKNHGVTCIPDVKRCQLTENDRFSDCSECQYELKLYNVIK